MSVDWDQLRRDFTDAASEHHNVWEGLPVPLEGHRLVLRDGHERAAAYDQFSDTIDGLDVAVSVGGPSDYFDEEVIVNAWFAWKLNCTVQIWKGSWKDPSKPARYFAIKIPRSPDGSMDRLTFWMQTLGASDAWDVDAEHRAREKLRGMLTDRQWRHYDLTGSFLETSPRSRLTYVFRRLRPTFVLTPRWPWYRVRGESMRCLAVLCMHPIGYYEGSWAGCMVPSDDVIAHLSFMRGDEAGFWREANQHEARRPEAGL